MSKIDIIIPYWGEFSLLREAVDSVLTQTDKSWHLTILDDHYTSLEAYNYYTSLGDNRISYIRHSENIGITNNFNYAITIAKEKYVTIMGCDDKLLPSYVGAALKNINKADFYQPNVDVIDYESNLYLPIVDRVKRFLRPNKSGILSGEHLASSLCIGNWLYFPSIVWRTDTLKKYKFDQKYKIVEDVVVELDMIIDGASLFLDTETTFLYRRFAESLSSREKSKNGVRFNEEDEVYDYFSKKFHTLGWHKAAHLAKLRFISRLHRLIS